MSPIPASTVRLLDCAVEAAQTAGRHALRNYSRRMEIAKSFKHDVKLKLDLECQQKAESVIRKAFPEHAVLGEESEAAETCGKNRFQWIIDPIDGTVNFSHGLPLWCCSVAVRINSIMQAGAVYAPVMKELYTAAADKPSCVNGRKMAVSRIPDLSRAIIHTGIDRNVGRHGKPLGVFEKLAFQTQKARVMGSAAYDICQVAAGHAEGYYEADIFIWDIAAAALIVKQAGGRVEMLRKPARDNRLSFLATNGLIHKQLKNLILS